jgi:hypothetical protein
MAFSFDVGKALKTAALGPVASQLAGWTGNLKGDNINLPGETPEQKQATAELLKNASLASGTGRTLLEQFNKGELTTGQETQVKTTTASNMAAVNDFFAKAGISDSSIATSARGQVNDQAAILTQQLLQGNLQDALAALGLGGQEYGAVVGAGQFQQNLTLQQELGQAQQDNAFLSNLLGAARAGGSLLAGLPTGGTGAGA